MKENETDDSVSECVPNNTNPDITVDVTTGKVSLDFDKGEWLLIIVAVSILSYVGIITF